MSTAGLGVRVVVEKKEGFSASDQERARSGAVQGSCKCPSA